MKRNYQMLALDLQSLAVRTKFCISPYKKITFKWAWQTLEVPYQPKEDQSFPKRYFIKLCYKWLRSCSITKTKSLQKNSFCLGKCNTKSVTDC